MRGVVEEYIWNESDDTIIYEKDGVEKRLTLQPNLMMTRLCLMDTNRYLIKKLEDANEEEASQNYERYLEYLSMGYCNFCEVLAVGRSRNWSRAEQKKYNIAKRWTIPVEVGDFVLMPEKDKWGRMWRYIFGKPYLHICETRVPILIIRKDDDDRNA